MIFVTGGAGFIGSNFVLDWLAGSAEGVVNVDKLTYAGNLDNLTPLAGDRRHVFVRADVADGARMAALLEQYRPRAIVHFAAESHVDRSIDGPANFIAANVNGTFALLEAARRYWSGVGGAAQAAFRFLHVSTDEVYGSLGPHDAPCDETRAYAPASPYAASKAAADHLVRAWHRTYGLPVLVTNCSNNYGPRCFPEKLIPLVITRALAGQTLPVYGSGLQVRDWLYVADHCAAIRRVLDAGVPGATYNVGGRNEMTNIDLVHRLCDLLDERAPAGASYRSLIRHVADRPGHDERYAIDASRLETELGWRARESLASGLAKTLDWYLRNTAWVERVASGAYRAADGDLREGLA